MYTYIWEIRSSSLRQERVAHSFDLFTPRILLLIENLILLQKLGYGPACLSRLTIVTSSIFDILLTNILTLTTAGPSKYQSKSRVNNVVK